MHLLTEQEVAPRARALARFVAALIPQSTVIVYTLGSDGSNTFWIPKAAIGEAAVHDVSIRSDSGLLGFLFEKAEPILRTASQLKREDYPHIDARRTLRSLCYIPLVNNDNLVGTMEILSFEQDLSKWPQHRSCWHSPTRANGTVP